MQTLKHKVRLIQLINEQLNDLDNNDLDSIIWGVRCLWRVNAAHGVEQPLQIEDEVVELLFVPHLPNAGLLRFQGRTPSDDRHRDALYALVKRAGGLRNVKLPGMATVLAL